MKPHALLALCLLLPLACTRQHPAPADAAFTSRKLLLPEHGVYAGAYIEFGDREDDVTLEKIEGFERMVGKHQAIVASSSYWGEQTFPDANVRLIVRHGSVPLLYWSPWDRPYVEGAGPDKYSLTSILAGAHDAYIDRWAEQARDVRSPIIVSFGNEMNGSWFPWSGPGAVVPQAGSAQLGPLPGGPDLFKRAYRYVVDRVRARGASNVQFVLHLMNFSDPQEKWNMAKDYYPGPEYCDWLGISLYGSQFPADYEWAPFAPLLDWPYTELCQLDPTKPIMLCEWGVAELPLLGNKAQWYRDAYRTLQDPRYGRLKAIVYWNERWQNTGDTAGEKEGNEGKYSNLRVNSSPEALEAFRQGLANPFYIGEPRYAP